MKTKNETVNREPNTVEPAQHTPGPWEVVHNSDGQRTIETTHENSVLVTEIDCSEPDARLIAAAPELLAALEACLSPLQDEYNRAGHTGHQTNASRAFISARAAIAAAKIASGSLPPDEAAANIVASSPAMLKDALANTAALNR